MSAAGTGDTTRLELTAAQRGLWYAQQLDPDNVVLNIAHYLDVPGEIDATAYRTAWATAISEVDALHATFGEDDDGPFQLVADAVDWDLQQIDLRDDADPEDAARAWMEHDLRSPVDLSAPPLFAIALLRVADDRTFCYQRIHHLALDGYGATLAMLRVNVVYNALVNGVEPDEPFTGPLVDLVDDDRSYRASERTEDREFWTEQLGDHPSPTLLADPPQGLPDRLSRCTRDVPADAAEALAAAAKAMKVSRSSLLIAAFAAYLHRFTGERDVVLGLPVTARRGKVAKSVPGMVSNIVPLRLDVRPETPIIDLAAQVSTRVRALLRHQRYRPEDVRADLGLGRDARLAGPTINILPIEGTLDFGGHAGTLHNLSVGPVDDMSVVVSRAPDGQGLRIDVDVNPDLYDAAELEGHLTRFLITLDAVARDHDSTVGAIRVSSEADRDVIGDATHGVAVDVVRRTVLDFFESQVVRTPDATALVAADSQSTFNELDRRANRLARLLMAHGAGPGAAVAVALPRRSQFAISLAATHKSGAVVMPVDPDYPSERVRQMLDDVAPQVVITDSSVAERLPELPEGATELVLDDPDVVADVLGRSNDPVTDAERGGRVEADDPAYVVYTSGSTGRPKGIVVQHRSLVNLFASHSSELFAPARAAVGGRPLRVAHVTPVSFDAGWDPVLWLIGGHELHLVDERTMADPEALVQFLVAHEIDFVETTPTYMEQLVSAGLLGDAGDSVRVVALGGEAVGRELWDLLASREDLLAFNLFGPAESTVDVVTARIENHDTPVIGRPVANARAYVLDTGLQMKPVGAAGELYLAGAGLARSYLGQPGRTAERFVADPYGGPGDRMYRTGDVARWRADGVLEFVERVDDQVKVRGFRVELGEIEARLGERDDVRAAAVVVRENDGVQHLVAYVAGDAATLTPASLRETVAAAVPAYMVPALYVVLPEMPLTPNGKLDREALPAPTGEETAAGAGREPQTPQEQLLAGLFAETLGLPRVGVDDDFFDLGGHSLLATRLVSRIRSAAGAELPIRALFDHPTVAGLARELAGAATGRAGLRAMTRPDELPLSFAQRRLWFLNQLDPGDAAYNIPAVLRLRGGLDVEALENAVHDVVARHETLRTTFPAVDGEPHQVVAGPDDVVLDVPTDDLEEAPADGPGSVDDVLRRETTRGFDLTEDLPIRVRLLRLGESEHVLSMVVHHVAGDGWSLGPLAADLAVAYGARVADGVPPDWSPLPVQYADYTLWQRELLGEEDDPASEITRQLDHWSRQLAGLPTEIDLPRDRRRPREPVAAPQGVDARVPVDLDPDLRDALVTLARAHDVSLFMVVEAALAALLGRLGAGTDVAIGVPVAGRTDEALDSLVGFFVNTLVLRNDLAGDPTFDELVHRVKTSALDAYAHQDVPFERVVEEVSPERSLTRHPLFQVMLAFQNNAPVDLALPGLDVSVDAAAGPAGAKFDLSVDLGEVERADGRTTIGGAVEYDPVLFDDATVRDLVVRLERLLAAVAADPGARIGAADLLDDAERAAALAATDRRDRAHRGTVVEAFAATAAARPGDLAVRAGDGELTFADLDARSAGLAAVLLDAGYAGQRVGVALPRGTDLVVALLAVLRAGAVYLPIDLEYPRARIEHILTDADPLTVLTDLTSADRLPEGTPTLLLDDDKTRRLVADMEGDATLPNVAPEDPAYLTYTSGSTGRPKGVLVDHGALGNLHAHQRRALHEPTAERLGRRARMAHTTAVSFDAAWDPVLWLVSGHELHLVDDDTRRDPEALVALVRDRGIDAVETTPSYVQALLTEGLGDTGLSLVLLGGEAVGATLWRELRAHPTLRGVNLYGPTEACVDTVVADLADHDSPVLGQPVDGVAAHVLDATLRPVPAGVPGELYLSGTALARGYAGRAAQTAERFVADPYGAPGSRMYRTGDLARRTRDGVLEFVGRVDDQVKVRGFRVELGEIESVLAEVPGVAAAAVAVRTDPSGAGRLAAWVVPDPGHDVDTDTVRAAAARTLPDYMVPVAWSTLDALPLTPNGKLDRDALPTADVTLGGGGRQAGTEEEQDLARLFAEVLGLQEPPPVDVGFFDLGGHSLLATRLVSRVRSELGVELGVRALFETPSVEQLAARLPEAGHARRAVTATDRPPVVPLSWAQHRLWFLNRLEDSSAAYHIPLAVRLRGELDADALEAALVDVVDRHEVLRTTLPEADGEPRQHVHDDAVVPLERVQVVEVDLDDALRTRAEAPFDLAADRPLRASLLRVGPDDHVLLLVVHHVAADGWSLGPLGRDLAEAYDARRAGRAPGREPLAVQYADYALWQREELGEADDTGSELSEQLAWWTEQLDGLPAELDLPTDRPRPVRGSAAGGEVRFTMDADLHERLVDFARRHDASPFMLLHASLAALLTRQGGGEDVPLGTPVAGRGDEALDELVGFFVNTLVLRTDTAGDPTLPELLDRVRRADVDAFAHADLPFERLVEALAPERSLSRHPLFQVMLTADATTPGDLGLTGLASEVLPVAAGSAKFDLSFSVAEHHDDDGAPAGITGVLEHAADLYDEGSALAIADRWVRLLDRWLDAPSTPLTAVPLLTDDERAAVLPVPSTETASDDTVLDAWARTVESMPDETALVAPATGGTDSTGGTQTLTYAEVADLADRLAGLLARRGIGRGDVVALAVPRSVGSVVGLLGILRSGATYLPIDPAQPEGRVQAVVRAASPALVLDADDLETLLRGTDAVPELPQSPTLPVGPRPGDAAYVLFTSGSTGEPKGVVVEHRSLATLLAHHRETLVDPAAAAAGRRLRVAHTTAVTFDASWDPVLWLVAGHELHLVDDETRVDPEALVALVADRGVDVLETTPSYVAELLRLGLPDLAVTALGGEAVGGDLWRDLAARPGRAVNLYGPTESTVDAVVADVGSADHPVIGRPVTGTRALVLDDRLAPVAPGVHGELYLAGAGLARAYLGRADLTAERFVADPYGPPGSRMYRTGDRARWTAEGALAFSGRTDEQVKVRGFRVEPGEVDAVLAALDGVARAATVAVTDASGATALASYLVPEAGDGLDLDAVRTAAAERLPDYMLPTAMAVLDELPLTAHGKLDRRALPEPETVGAGGGTPPRTPRERVLAALFAEVLGVGAVGAVGVDDSFFALGGHSLLATRLVSRIRTVTGEDLAVRALFESPTVAGLAARLDGGDGAAEDAGLDRLVTLGAEGGLTPLVAVHPISGLAWPYAGLVPYLADRPLLGLQAPGLTADDPLPADVDALVDGYVAALRDTRPHGPYALLGWSLGGVLAHRVAARLLADGEEVEHLLLLDSYPHAVPLTVDTDDPTSAVEAYRDAQGDSADALIALLGADATDRLARGVGAVGDALRSAGDPPQIEVPTTLVAARPGPDGPPLADQWAPYVGGRPTEHRVDHAHFDLMDPEALVDVGPVVDTTLRGPRR